MNFILRKHKNENEGSRHAIIKPRAAQTVIFCGGKERGEEKGWLGDKIINWKRKKCRMGEQEQTEKLKLNSMGENKKE